MLVAKPTGAEAQISFAALGDLVDEALDEAVDVLPDPQRRALAVALVRAEPDGAAIERRAIALGVRGVLRFLAARQQVLIAVDDVQWLDRSSALVWIRA